MSSFRNSHTSTENEVSRRFSDVPSPFKRRQFNDWRCLCPRRYVLTVMHFILLIIHAWRDINVIFTLAHVIVLEEEAAKIKYSSIGHWTLKELDTYKTGVLLTGVFAQMPGALLIFIFSSHKFLLITVFLSSILHMITPVVLNHHSISLLFVLIAESVISAPLFIAVMTTWKDWAPPTERTKLMMFSFYALFLGTVAGTFYPLFFHYVTTDASFYLSGIAGIIWVLLWFNIMSDTPQNDPLISEEELIYLENNIPSDNFHKLKVKDIPWTSIIFSKPVLFLCLIYFKTACSIGTIAFSGTILSFQLGSTYNPLYFFIPFLFSFAIFMPLSAILADWLIKKFSEKSLLIRKIFVCGGFLLQCVFMFDTLSSSEYIETIFYMIAYSIFAACVPGFISIALDLSPRYISIIAGIIFTFFMLGLICTQYIVDATVLSVEPGCLSWLFLFDGGLTILSIIFFAMWGDDEEQLWSLTSPTNRKTNDYRSYPKPEDQDDLNLVT